LHSASSMLQTVWTTGTGEKPMQSSTLRAAALPTEMVPLADDELTKVAGGQALLTLSTNTGQVGFTTTAPLSTLLADLGAANLAALERGVQIGNVRAQLVVTNPGG